jgi:hypothetical protein
MKSSSHLTISRHSPEDVQNRPVIIKLNGERIATLMYGQSVSREIEPGRHSLLIDNTWEKKKLEFELFPGSDASFQVINKAGRLTNFMVALIGSGPLYVEIRRDSPPSHL